MKSRIETNPQTGRESLIVFYDSESDDFNETINQAVAFHNIRPGQMNVIALPKNLDLHLRPGP
jgi:hypothetical protein